MLDSPWAACCVMAGGGCGANRPPPHRKFKTCRKPDVSALLRQPPCSGLTNVNPDSALTYMVKTQIHLPG